MWWNRYRNPSRVEYSWRQGWGLNFAELESLHFCVKCCLQGPPHSVVETTLHAAASHWWGAEWKQKCSSTYNRTISHTWKIKKTSITNLYLQQTSNCTIIFPGWSLPQQHPPGSNNHLNHLFFAIMLFSEVPQQSLLQWERRGIQIKKEMIVTEHNVGKWTHLSKSVV